MIKMADMMKNLLTIFFAGFLVFGVSAQQSVLNDTLPAPQEADTISADNFINPPGLLPYNPDKKVSLRMEMGTSFGVGSDGGSMFGVYAAPHISYKVSPRFRVNFGAMVRNSNFINYYNPYFPGYPEYSRTFDSNITQTFVYAEGQYLVNPNLMVNAKVYKEVSVFDEPKMNPRALDLDGGGMSVGFNYRVNDNFSFGAEFGYNKGRSPYNPYYPGSYGTNPFGIPSMSPFDPWP